MILIDPENMKISFKDFIIFVDAPLRDFYRVGKLLGKGIE